jgi:hypothetical protein
VVIPREAKSADGLYAEAGAGVGWASTGDWFLQNAAAGAPYERSTVNAVTPAVAVHLGYRRGLLVVGVGGDLVVTPGAWHSLPTGDKHLQAWAGGYGYVGVPWVQATIGLEAPWYLALGGQADIPLAGPLGLYARATYGYGLPQDRGDDPAFEPLPAFSAWGGLRLRLGGRSM